MEAIRNIGISICISMVVTSIFSMLVPDTKMDKVLKFAISLFFLTSIISPFMTNKINFTMDFSEVSKVQSRSNLIDTSNKQFSELAAVNLERSLTKILSSEGVVVQKIVVTINKSETGDISISKLMVYLDETNENRRGDIENIVKREVGITPTITIKSKGG